MSDYAIRIDCPVCGGKHEIDLDASGHYDGPAPCDPHKKFRLQITPEQWRETMETEREKVKH